MKTVGVSKRGIFWLVVNLLQCTLPSAGAGLKCQVQFPDTCTLNFVRVNNGRWIDRLATIVASNTSKVTIIKRCLVFNRTSVQSMLEATGQLYGETTLHQYHEQSLAITSRMTSESLGLHSAPFLTHLQFLPNRHLHSLHIVNSALRRIPATIANLPNLRFLGIDKAYIRVLDLGILCTARKLKTLQLIKNQIHMLLPALESTCGSPLRDLSLDYNHLMTLDMTVLAPFVALQRLFLDHNHMKSLHCSNATFFPVLQLVTLGSGNNLTWIELEPLHISVPFTLNLPDNQFKRLPILNHNKMPGLQRVYLDGNQLSTVDLAQFHRHQHLDGFHFSRNQLRSVTCEQHVYLPLLETMELSTNMLESFSLENCSFPNLKFIALRHNRIQYVLAEIYRSDVSPDCVLDIQSNPVQCSSLQEHVKLLTTPIVFPKLLITIAAKCNDMNFNGRIRMSKTNSACCVV